MEAWSLHRVILCLVVAGMSVACQPPPPRTANVSEMPELFWQQPEVPDFANAQRDPERSWRLGVEGAKVPLEVPEALETRIQGQPREVWQAVVEALERYREHKRDMLRIATAPWPLAERCEQGATPRLPYTWDVQAQMLIQQRRHVLWFLGRLELAARSVSFAIESVQDGFQKQRTRNARDGLVEPLRRIQRHLHSYDTPATRPEGDWRRGTYMQRFARHRPLLLLLVRLEEALLDWQKRVQADERWNYVIQSVDPILESLDTWYAHHATVLEAVDSYRRQIRVMKRHVGRAAPDDPPPVRCVRTLVVRLGRNTSVLFHTLHMQRELATMGQGTRALLELLPEHPSHDAIAKLERSIHEHTFALMELEVGTLQRWDQDERLLWRELFPEIAQLPITRDKAPTELTDTPASTLLPREISATRWRKRFFDLRRSHRPRRHGTAEPLRPEKKKRRRRKKRTPPLISQVLDLARAPGAVASVEKGLLGIRELDAHMSAMHDAIRRACPTGDCTSLPDPGIEGSPRNSAYAELWSSTPVEERSLGHNLLVLELTRLHLARQVDGLAAIHAWFSERSSADITWPELHGWDQTWELYTGQGGSYLYYLQQLITLVSTVEELSTPEEELAPFISPRLKELLVFQRELVHLTLEYARFADLGRDPPIPVATLIDTWNGLRRELDAIEAATLERDAKLEAEREKAAEP